MRCLIAFFATMSLALSQTIYSPPTPLSLQGIQTPSVVEVADFNQDQRYDIVEMCSVFSLSTVLNIHLQNPDGSFQTTGLTYPGMNVFDIPKSIEIVDLDQDGDQDVIHFYVSSFSSNDISYVFWQNTNGTFHPAFQSGFVVTQFLNGPVVIDTTTIDLNHDGTPEVVVQLGSFALFGQTLAPEGFQCLQWNGGQIDHNLYYGYPSVGRIAKIKNGNFEDLALVDSFGAFHIMHTSRSGLSSPVFYLSQNSQTPISLRTFDYGRDGDDDLLCLFSDGSMAIFEDSLMGWMVKQVDMPNIGQLTELHVADLDFNGSYEVVFANQLSGRRGELIVAQLGNDSLTEIQRIRFTGAWAYVDRQVQDFLALGDMRSSGAYDVVTGQKDASNTNPTLCAFFSKKHNYLFSEFGQKYPAQNQISFAFENGYPVENNSSFSLYAEGLPPLTPYLIICSTQRIDAPIFSTLWLYPEPFLDRCYLTGVTDANGETQRHLCSIGDHTKGRSAYAQLFSLDNGQILSSKGLEVKVGNIL